MSRSNDPYNKRPGEFIYHGETKKSKSDWIDKQLKTGMYDEESINSLYQEWENMQKKQQVVGYVDRADKMVAATPYDLYDRDVHLPVGYEAVEEFDCTQIPGLTLFRGVK